MNFQKRTRENDDSHDIRVLFKKARVKAALTRSGPFFLERILFPRLVHVHYRFGSTLPDPTRLRSEMATGAVKISGCLTLPHHIEASAWLQRYERLQHSELRTVVSSDLSVSPMSVVTDIVFDMQEQFAVVCQPKHLHLYNTEDWLEGVGTNEALGNSLPLVKVEARALQRLGFGFSAVQFLSSSLQLVVGYYQAPFVDIFDLEEVDEETCNPQQRFTLTGNCAGGSRDNTATYTESAYANDVVAVTEHLSLAALSSGLSVWLDRRSGKTSICTGIFTREYNIGQQCSRTSTECGPLTAIAFLCRNDPVNILCGTKMGTVQLWDVRYNRSYIALHQTGATICRLQPPYASSLRGVIWLNNLAGEVQGLSVGHSDMRLIARAKCMDVERSTETFYMPLPRLAVLDPPGLIASPHVSSNSLLLYSTHGLAKMLSTTAGSHNSGNNYTVCGGIDASTNDDDHECDEHHVSQRSTMMEVLPNVRGDHTGLSNDNDFVKTIPLKNVLSYKELPNITACGVWSKYGRFVMGDASGRVQLA